MIISVKISERVYVIGNVYGPNVDTPTFYQTVISMFDLFDTYDAVLIGGDFNLVLDPKLDRNGSLFNHSKSKEILEEYMERTALCDIWRICHPEERRYTWHKWSNQHRPTCSRIDMLLAPVALIDIIEKSDIEIGCLTDHSMVTMTMALDQYVRGPGVWKFNNLLLNDRKFCEKINDFIPWIASKCDNMNPNDRWETIMMETGRMCKRYAKKQAKLDKDNHNKLLKLKVELESKVLSNEHDKENTNRLIQTNAKLDEELIKRANSCIFRSQCKYARDGEKCSAYFMSIEKRRYLEKNMKAVINDKGELCTNQQEILKVQTDFYKELYKSDQTVQFTFKPTQNEKLISEAERNMCEAPFTTDEFYDACMTLKSGKVPGHDGITIEFFRIFWKVLAPYLVEMYQFSYEMGLLPESVRKGLISLLPKRNKNTKYVKNFRPLTLLSNSYKILAKAIDNRLRVILPDLLKNEQTGFVKGRKICHNIRKSLDIIDYTRLKQLPGLILSIDMEKCFDRLEHRSIFKSLEYFGFGDGFIRWISLFYNRFLTCTQNFGFLSDYWIKGRGTNQGCPLSPSLYLLTAEIMANKIRQHPGIKGIKMGEIEYIISQFADDTDLYLNYDQGTLDNTLEILSDVEKNTGLKVSYDKTTLYRIGSLANSNAKLHTSRRINWENDYINTLGIDISNCHKLRNMNFVKVISKLKAVASMWYYRTMTITGKVVVVNTLMSSLFVYKMQVLPVLNMQQIEEIEAIIQDFIWNGKKPKIKFSILKLKKEDGGLGLVDLKIKHRALLFNWIKDCSKFPEIANLAKSFLGNYVQEGILWQFNLTRKDGEKYFKGQSFWHQLYYEWCEYSYIEPHNKEKVCNQNIIYNSLIKINGEVIVNDEWLKNNMV